MSEEGQESRENVILGPSGTGHAEKSANIVEDLVNLERKTAYSQLEGLAQTPQDTGVGATRPLRMESTAQGGSVKESNITGEQKLSEREASQGSIRVGVSSPPSQHEELENNFTTKHPHAFMPSESHTHDSGVRLGEVSQSENVMGQRGSVGSAAEDMGRPRPILVFSHDMTREISVGGEESTRNTNDIPTFDIHCISQSGKQSGRSAER